jgi:hypothetical protein
VKEVDDFASVREEPMTGQRRRARDEHKKKRTRTELGFCLSRKGSISIHIFYGHLASDTITFFIILFFSHTQSRRAEARREEGVKGKAKGRCDDGFLLAFGVFSGCGGQVQGAIKS